MIKQTTDWKKELQELLNRDSFIKESEVLCKLPVEEHTNWDNFMRGKTCPRLDNGDHGVYGWDLKQFLNKVK